MIIGDNREQVIQNIKEAIAKRDWHAKVEIGDPVLSLKESKELVNNFWHEQKTVKGK